MAPCASWTRSCGPTRNPSVRGARRPVLESPIHARAPPAAGLPRLEPVKILLAYKSGRPGAGDYFARMMPVGLGWINATLRAHRYDSRLANLSALSWERCEALLRRERPDLIGITL